MGNRARVHARVRTWLHLSVLMHVSAQASASGQPCICWPLRAAQWWLEAFLSLLAILKLAHLAASQTEGVTQTKGSRLSIDGALRGEPRGRNRHPDMCLISELQAECANRAPCCALEGHYRCKFRPRPASRWVRTKHRSLQHMSSN